MNNKEFKIFLNFIFILCYSYTEYLQASFEIMVWELFRLYIPAIIPYLAFAIFVLLDKIYVKIILYIVSLYFFIVSHIHGFFIPFSAEPTHFDFILWHSGVLAFSLQTYLIIYFIYLERKNYLRKSEDERCKDRSLWRIVKRFSYPLIAFIINYCLCRIMPNRMGNILY